MWALNSDVMDLQQWHLIYKWFPGKARWQLRKYDDAWLAYDI